jgi:hypothetical protein
MSQQHNSGQNHTANKSFENMEKFKYLGMTVTNKNGVHEEIRSRLHSGTAYYNLFQNISSHLMAKMTKIRIHRTTVLPVVFYGSEI